MGKIITIAFILFLWNINAHGQEEKLEVDGAIQISDSDDPTPDPGTIRYNSVTNDFEGWNGEWMSLTRIGDPIGSGVVADIDGNRYLTVKLGTQTWMRENLRTSRYRNGDKIPEIPMDIDWAADSIGSWCWYDNSNFNDIPTGKLYNWYVVEDSRGLCPNGWHVPTVTEWTVLIDSLGGQSISGGKMKEKGLTHWGDPNIGSTNESGFTGLPGGYRNVNGSFVNMTTYCNWWTSIETSGSVAKARNLQNDEVDVNYFNYDKRLGNSVRCIKD